MKLNFYSEINKKITKKNTFSRNNFLILTKLLINNKPFVRNTCFVYFSNFVKKPSINKLHFTNVAVKIKGGTGQDLSCWSRSKYYFVGLGYKVYVHKGNLFVWVGLTHYTIIKLPTTVLVFAKKKRIYLLGSDTRTFDAFVSTIRIIKKKDIFKGKGLLEVKSYRDFIKMKTGKKKQY